MTGIIEFIKDQIANNEFFQGGLLITLIASAGYFLKSIPLRIWGLIKGRILFTVWFDSRDPLFSMYHSWVNRQPFVRKKRSVRIITNHQKDPPEVIMTFGYGTYVVRHGGVWMLIGQAKDDGKMGQKGNGDSFQSMMMLETYSVTCFYWRRQKIMDLLRNVVDSFSIEETGEVPIYHWEWGYWHNESAQTKKSLDKLILKDGLREEITNDVEQFLASSKWYESMQIPYQRGYLLTGPPGTGKTTLAACLASRYNLRLCVLDLAEVTDDGRLRKALTTSPGRSIVLVEDFDAFFEGRKNVNLSSKITFSGLLNAINGVVSNQGRMLILTTNKESTVDPALARVGRIDRRFHLGYADASQASRLFNIYHPSLNGQAEAFGELVNGRELSPADITGHFQNCRSKLPDLMDIEALVIERDAKRDLSLQIAVESREELKAKKKERKKEEDVPEENVNVTEDAVGPSLGD